MKALVVVGSLLLAGCGARSLQQPDGGPPGVIEPGSTTTTLRPAWLAFADDGLLLASSRETVVRFDPALNEIDRTSPPWPFDGKVSPRGRMYYSASRDGRAVAIAWQGDSPEPPSVKAGAVVFDIPSALPIVTYGYPVARGTEFRGMALSPDGQLTASSQLEEVLVTSLPGGGVWWRANKSIVEPPQFSGDGAALVVARDDFALEVVRASDGAPLLMIEAPGWHSFDPVTVSADGSTLAAATNDGRILSWRMSDGAPLAAAPIPSDLGSIPRTIALSPRGDMLGASMEAGGAGALLVWAGDRLLYRRDGETDALAFSPDGGALAVASPGHGLQLLRASDGAVLAERILSR
jgi:WD40 repeat protein